jgi:hypothetical protein
MKFVLACLSPRLRLAQTTDVRTSADHPLVRRFEGAVITHYQTKESKFLTAAPGKPGSPIAAEGKLTDILYQAITPTAFCAAPW